MKKRISCLILCLTLMLSLGVTALAAETPDSTASVVVDGVTMENFSAVGYSRTTYVSLYGMTMALRPDTVVTWEDGQMVARGSDFTLSARVGAAYMVANGRYLYISGGVKADETGDTLVPTRVIAEALGAELAWDKDQGVVFTSGTAPILSGDEFYNATDLDLISRVIQHESGNQPLTGKIGVANVILNRVSDGRFPGTVSDVIYEQNQFPGATNANPSAESILAAKLAMDGAMTVPGALYFNGAGKDCWAARNKNLIAVIGGHAFYG